MDQGNVKKAPELVLSSQDFFSEIVDEACNERQLETIPQATRYLVDMLVFYMNTDNLFDEEDVSGRKTRDTLAEMFLKAGSAQGRVKIELLKKLGDTALYISGFFGESLQRKLIDVDYYMDMGETAYGSLAKHVNEDMGSRVYSEFSNRFLAFADVLTYISSKSIRPAEGNLLQLFEKYVSTGSDHAKDEILNQGLITVPMGSGRKYRQ